MLGGNWTEKQWEAITGREKDFLVTAGAGSGKTRVLVHRILQRVKDRNHPLDIDRMLVVTFTKAAASEMKQRIGAALEEALSEEAYSAHLRRQFLLLNRATISTLHSFCLDLIKRYYYLRNLDPAFRMLDETEAQLLQAEIMEELLEERYQNNEPRSPFYKLVDCYSSEKGDEPLQDLLLRVYTMSRGHLWPELRLDEMLHEFSSFNRDSEQESWWSFLLDICRQELESMDGRLDEALELASKPGGPEPYHVNLKQEKELLQRALSACDKSWEEMVSSLHFITFERLKRCSGQQYDEELRNRVVSLRDSCKKDLSRLRSEISGRPLQEQLQELDALFPLLEELVDLVKEFGARYNNLKKERGSADFSDLEHYALQILCQPHASGKEIIPSEAALECRRNYEEVLVDEYQDINRVQEAILKLVSRPAPEGNQFLVGDVRQSIYRFRQAEPELFLEKQAEFSANPDRGKGIELTENFRSREQVLNGINYLFSQFMDKEVGEVNYNDRDYLRCGASYPPLNSSIEVALISREGYAASEKSSDISREGEKTAKHDNYTEPEENPDYGKDLQTESAELDEDEELENAALEGRFIAKRIKELLGGEKCKAEGGGLQLYDRDTGKMRPASYRDIVILLRSSKNWAPAIMEELQAAGIPVYVELDTGYFNATEIEVMLSLLHIIDNPLQDIPLAAVLRSPLVGLNADQLSAVRLEAPSKSYYEAVQQYCRNFPQVFEVENALGQKLLCFQEQLDSWRELSRKGSLAELIWQVYRESGYYDFVGGMPGGAQRQANLRALYDRARRYEESTFRGLFRFLKFLERIRKKGGDLGEARSLSESEDVVRIMTIHKSKGLEFPVVFMAGLHKRFNLRDLRGNFLLHKQMGFGPRYIDTENRITYPTLPWLAIRRRLRLELLAEEMRILYVAMTRAEEKLFLVASTRDISRDAGRWAEVAGKKERLLPSYYRAKANSFLDWIGPPLMSHPHGKTLRKAADVAKKLELDLTSNGLEGRKAEQSSWEIDIISPGDLKKGKSDAEDSNTTYKAAAEELDVEDRACEDSINVGLSAEWKKYIKELEPLPVEEKGKKEIERRLNWSYPYQEAVNSFAKFSVSELSRMLSLGLKGEEGLEPSLHSAYSGSLQQRPRFLRKEALTFTEKGMAYHTVMQHLKLDFPLEEENVGEQLREMLQKELLTPIEQETVNEKKIFAFLSSTLGQRMYSAQEVLRETPFTLAIPMAEEQVILQGVIDCIIKEEDGLVLLDYKTDNISGIEEEELKKRFATQLGYYELAAERILGEKVKEKYLYFFHGNLILRMEKTF